MKNWLGTLLMLTLVPAAVACGDDGEEGTTGTSNARDVSSVLALLPAADAQGGSVLYPDLCGEGTCHGSTGDNGTSGSSLSAEVPALTDEQLAIIIKYGNIDEGGTMPPVVASDEDIADVMAYVIQEFR